MSAQPITAVFEFPNDSVAKYDQALAELGERKHPPARSHQICFETPTGFTVVDVWESEDALAHYRAIIGPVLQKVGLQTVPKIYPLHTTL